MESKYFNDKTNEEINEMIQELPEHLKNIYDQKIDDGYEKRHALFVAKSYSWRKPCPEEK